MQLVRKKEVWIPTWQGFLLSVLFAGTLIYGAVLNLYPFLARNNPQPAAEIVIIEGWLMDDALEEAALAIRPGQIVVTTGGPVEMGEKFLDYNNYAEMAGARLVALGIPAETIITVPAPYTVRDRTYVSAQAVRRKLEERGLFGKPANLYTLGAHARRSEFLYRRVFGRNYPLGTVSVEPARFDLRHWYRHSVGVKHVLTELIAWLYAHFFLVTRHV